MESSSKQFGLMVAYLLPGFIVLAGIAPFAPFVAAWLQPLDHAEASLGAPLYAVLAATTIGMIVSCFRWLIIDHLHHWTGITPPAWNDSRLEERIGAFNYLVDNHYRYYQFYANTLISVALAYLVNRLAATSPLLGAGTDVACACLCIVLFAGSRDALLKYFLRTTRLIGSIRQKGGIQMTNGNHHEAGGTTSVKPRPDSKPQGKPQTAAPPPKRDSRQDRQSSR